MDQISNMLTSIRNAQAVSHETAIFPFSKLNYEIAKILESKGFIEKVEKKKRRLKKRGISSGKQIIEVTLKYNDGRPVISGLRRVSKQSQRVYLPWKKIKPVKNGFGISIISTSKGLITDKEARKKKLGGEVICEVW